MNMSSVDRGSAGGMEGVGEECERVGAAASRCRDGMCSGSVDEGRMMSATYSSCADIGIVCGDGESRGLSGAGDGN